MQWKFVNIFWPGTLADKSGNMFDFCGNTSSTRAGALSRHVFSLIFPTTQQSHSFSMSPGTSPIAASGATNVKKCHHCPPVWIHSSSQSVFMLQSWYSQLLSTGCLILLATPKFPYLPESRKNRVINWPPFEMTKSRTCHPQKITKPRTCHP